MTAPAIPLGERTALIDGMSDAEYRALPGLSGTAVADILRSPARYQWGLSHPSESSPAMALGTLVHALVLDQPHPFVVSKYADFRSKAAQEYRAERLAAGVIPISADVAETAEAIHVAVHSNPTAHALLTAPGMSEVTVTGEHRGHPLKGRIDRLPANGRVLDLKTTRDASPGAFAKSVGDYGYHSQLAHYDALGGNGDAPIIIAVENEAPHLVAVYVLDDDTFSQGKRLVAEAWSRYADCREADSWPDGMPDGIAAISLPTWARTAWEKSLTYAMEA